MNKALHGILALLAATYGSFGMAQCPPGTSQVTVFSTDFEHDDGGFVESGGGDWEYGVIPVAITGTNCGGVFQSPGGAHSGTKGWGTVLDDCYQNLGAFSGTGFTVDLSNPGYTGATLEFAHWYNVFTNFDYIRVTANGTVIFLNNSQENSSVWITTSVDLGSFLGQSSVSIVFELYATTVVNRAGWYIDDVSVTACTSGTAGIVGEAVPTFQAWPVPASEVLHVEPSGKVMHWVLYDGLGRVLTQGGRGVGGRFDVDVTGFHGVGVLELKMEDGTVRQRVIMD